MQKYHSIANVAIELWWVATLKKKYDTNNEQDHADSTTKAEMKKREEVKVAKLNKQDQKVKEKKQSEKIDEKVMKSDGKLKCWCVIKKMQTKIFWYFGHFHFRGILVILIIEWIGVSPL